MEHSHMLRAHDDSQVTLFGIDIIPTNCVQAPLSADEHSKMIFSENNQDLKSKPLMEENTSSPSVETLPQPGIVLNVMSSDDLPHSNETVTPSSEQASPSVPSSSETCQFLPTNQATLISSSPLMYADVVANNHSLRITSSNGSTESSPSSSQSFTQCYASLTAWTTKLTSEDLGELPPPNKESVPIPLISLHQQPCIPASSAPVYSKPNLSKGSSNLVYGKIGAVQPSSGGVSRTQISSLAGDASHRIRVSSISKSKLKSHPNKEHRFKKTADALQKSGLWEVAMKTGNLIKRNQELQKELEQFRADALVFLKSVIKNPQNRDFIKNVLNNALLANNTHQRKASVMSVVVSAAAAAASMKLKSSNSIHDSGISSSGSCGTQSDHSVSNFPCTNFRTTSPGSTSQVLMDFQ